MVLVLQLRLPSFQGSQFSKDEVTHQSLQEDTQGTGRTGPSPLSIFPAEPPSFFPPCLLKSPLQIHTALKEAKTPQHSKAVQRKSLKAKTESCSKKAKWLKPTFTPRRSSFPQLKSSLSALNSHKLSVMSPIAFHDLKYNFSHASCHFLDCKFSEGTIPV